MTATTEAFGIDDPIMLGGRQTTLREEHQIGKVALVRNLVAQPHKQPSAYWAILRTDGETAAKFQISRNDFKLLSGK
jgi:hypothetical protein